MLVMWKTPFERRLHLVLLSFFALQNALYFLVLFLCGLSATQTPALWFFPLNFVFHGIILLALSRLKAHYKDSATGKPLERVSVPNALTLIRASSLPALSMLFLLSRDYPVLSLPLVIWVAAAFLTDLFDGFLSRLWGQVSDLGKILDSSTDYVVLFSLTVVLGISGVLPLWFFILVMVRVFWQTGIMMLLTWKQKALVLETTFLGKASFFALMALLTLEILVFFRMPGLEDHWSLRVLEYGTAALLVASLFDKLEFFFRWWRPGANKES